MARTDIYISQLAAKLKNRLDRDPMSHDRRPSTITTKPNLGPSAKHLVYIHTQFAIWFIAVVGHTYRDIDSASPSQNLKNVKICPDRPPRAVIDHREGRNGPNPSERSFGKLIWVHTNATEDTNHSTWAYLARNGCQQPRQEP